MAPSSSGPWLRTTLLRWLLIPLLLLVVADGFYGYRVAHDLSQRAYDKALVEAARDLALHLHDSGGRVELDLPESSRRILFGDDQDQMFFEVVSADGTVLAGEPIPAAPPGARSEAVYDSRLHELPVRVAQLSGMSVAPSMVVRVAETTARRSGLAREIAANGLVPQAVMLALTVLLVWIAVHQGLAALDDLQREVASRSHLDRRPVSEASVPGEVRPLVRSINGLLARLDRIIDLQSRFITDAAHQIKTPVAGIKAQVELLMRETDAARARQLQANVYLGIERMTRLVSQLLVLARNDPAAFEAVARQPLDLQAFALEVTSSWVAEARRRGIDLGFEGAEDLPLVIEADRRRLTDLLDNLLDNAIRYSRQGGRVTVRVEREPYPGLSISDDAARIPDADRERVFMRFHRLGESEPGSGLGLAIVKEIASRHGATIEVLDDHDGEGNLFKVTFRNTPSQAA